MTFGLSKDQGKFEWANTHFGAFFCQRRNLLSPRMWRLFFDIIRFKSFALDVLLASNLDARPRGTGGANHLVSVEETIGQYLEREGYSDIFRDDYLIPLTAAVWGTSRDQCSLELPAVALIRVL